MGNLSLIKLFIWLLQIRRHDRVYNMSHICRQITNNQPLVQNTILPGCITSHPPLLASIVRTDYYLFSERESEPRRAALYSWRQA